MPTPVRLSSPYRERSPPSYYSPRFTVSSGPAGGFVNGIPAAGVTMSDVPGRAEGYVPVTRGGRVAAVTRCLLCGRRQQRHGRVGQHR